MKQPTGKMIVIEAGDGSGKATQTQMLYERLLAEEKAVRRVEFPDYASDSSALVRMYLGGKFGASADDVNAYAAATFFAVDRYASFHMKWKKYYEDGYIILADRYTTSNMAHQAVKLTDKAARDDFLAWLEDFEFGKLGLPVPDIVLFLDMEPTASEKLLAARAASSGGTADIHERDRAYLSRCYEAYKELAARYGWRRVKCSEDGEPLSAPAIHRAVYEAVRDIWAK